MPGRRGLFWQYMVQLLALPLGTAMGSVAKAADDSRLHEGSAPSATVRALPAGILAPKPADPSSTDFVEAYYESILQWGQIVADQVRPVEEHSSWSYLGLPEHTEDHVRPTAYAAMVLGFLAEFRPPRSAIDDAHRQRMRSAAVALLRYLTASHITGGKTCLNGKPWGNHWQSAMWARAAGMAAWLLWPQLDDDLQQAIIRMIEYEADRFVEQPPKNQLRGDTGAEENAWNASIAALACTMMPGHSRAQTWSKVAKRYMYNTFSVRSDSQNAEPGDDARLVRDWVTTINAHDDFTLENHGLVHVGYLKTAACELQENAVHWLLVGEPVPQACQHHLQDVFAVLLSCMAWDASPVYFGGNDWKIFHSQCTDIIVYTMMNLLARDARAAHLEIVALDWLRRQQRAEGGYYNVRRDLEYGGLCATRLISCCLAHGAVGKTTKPVSDSDFARVVSGVRYLPSACAILHRTPSKFASFSWAHRRMALALPRDGNWVVWPHFASFLGLINGEDTSERRARLTDIRVDTEPNGFRVSGTLARCQGQVIQDFFFASPAGDYTVYLDRLRAEKGYSVTSRETGIIGVEYPLGSNSLSVFGQFGTQSTTGYGGEAQTQEWSGNWLNLNDRVGYVVCRSDRQCNVMRYHDENRGTGRVPQLQEWIGLVSGAEPPLGTNGAWTCIVTFLNQTARQTSEAVSHVHLDVDEHRATCRIGDDTIEVTLPP